MSIYYILIRTHTNTHIYNIYYIYIYYIIYYIDIKIVCEIQYLIIITIYYNVYNIEELLFNVLFNYHLMYIVNTSYNLEVIGGLARTQVHT